MAGVKILVAGDTHGIVEAAEKINITAQNHHVTLIIQVGDFMEGPAHHNGEFLAACASSRIPWVFLRGNHDDTKWLRSLNNGFLTGKEPVRITGELYWAPDGSTLTVSGIKIGFLGGAFSTNRHKLEQGVTWWEDENISEEAVIDLEEEKKLDILFTHEAPSGLEAVKKRVNGLPPIPEIETNRNLVSRAVAATNPQTVFHGHLHHSYVEKYLDTDTLVTGLGCDGRDNSQKIITFN